MEGDAKVADVEVEGEGEKRVGWIIGEELSKARGEEGWEDNYEQHWPFRASSGTEDWEGRAYVLYVWLSRTGHDGQADFQNTCPYVTRSQRCCQYFTAPAYTTAITTLVPITASSSLGSARIRRSQRPRTVIPPRTAGQSVRCRRYNRYSTTYRPK